MCYQNYFFCPEQFEHMTKKVMVLFLNMVAVLVLFGFFTLIGQKNGPFVFFQER